MEGAEEGNRVLRGPVLGGPWSEEDIWSQPKADVTATDLEARNTCWWGTLQVSTAQLLRYISPMSLRTLKAGRHGEKKAPILKWQKGQVSLCVSTFRAAYQRPHGGARV